jgi:hypothetical protein
MEGLVVLIVLCLFLMFGAPLILIIAGLVRLRTKKDSAKKLLIIGIAWLVIGAGTCATLLNA